MGLSVALSNRAVNLSVAIVHGPDKILVTSGGAKDFKYQLVGRINMNKILYDNPTKRVAYRINLAFLF